MSKKSVKKNNKKEIMKEILSGNRQLATNLIVKDMPENDKKVNKIFKNFEPVKRIPEMTCSLPPTSEKKDILPREDPNFLSKIRQEADVLNKDIFENSLINCLELENQKEIVSKKQNELTEIKGKQPFQQYLITKEYKQAKKEFYFDIVHQIISMRLQIVEKIKVKYGEEIAKAVLFRMRKDIADIWMNDEGYGVKIEEKNKELKEAHVKLEEIKANQSNVLSELPKVTGYDLLENSPQIKTEYPEDCFSSNPLEINCSDEEIVNIEEIDIVDEIGEIINKGWMKDRIRVHRKNS